jgi:hypothetical protein
MKLREVELADNEPNRRVLSGTATDQEVNLAVRNPKTFLKKSGVTVAEGTDVQVSFQRRQGGPGPVAARAVIIIIDDGDVIIIIIVTS